MLVSLSVAEKRVFSYTEFRGEKRVYNAHLGSCLKSDLAKRYLGLETTVGNYLLPADLRPDSCCPGSRAREMPGFWSRQEGGRLIRYSSYR